jgi:hypothetical protein
MSAVRYPIRYRQIPHGPDAFKALHAEGAALLDRATELDAAQQALAAQLADVRTQLAELRIVMWPHIDFKNLAHGFRRTRRSGPAPIPARRPPRPTAVRKASRSTALAVLARNARPMTLVEIHRELHLNDTRSRHAIPSSSSRIPSATKTSKVAPVASNAASTPWTN